MENHLSLVIMKKFLWAEKLLLNEQREEKECQACDTWEHSEMRGEDWRKAN